MILIGILVLLVGLSVIAAFVPAPPKSSNQSRLDRTIGYFADQYNFTLGLIPESPRSNTYWLYSDNYLVTLALARYDSVNSSTGAFAASLNAALEGYVATLPPPGAQSQFAALNSTSASFDCPLTYAVAWLANGQLAPGTSSAFIKTTTNYGSEDCTTENYADTILLRALQLHRLGNATGAAAVYNLASADFDGKGFADKAFNGTLYQTYKLALFVYTSSCLGDTNGESYATATRLLFSMQDNSTGGFYTVYNASLSPRGTSVNTETTALAALALEQLIRPLSSC